MQEEKQNVQFDRDLHHYISMAIEIWPTFRSGVKHLQQVGQPSADSFLPPKGYNAMNEQTFRNTIVGDMYDFIMTHDVTVDDINDYLYDIIDLLMMEEQLIGGSSNPASIDYMANYTHQVIQQLQQGRRDKLDHFQINIYQNVKQFSGSVIESKAEESGEQEGERQSGSESDSQDIDQQMDIEEKQQQKSQQQINHDKQLQDDGWIIVKKK